MCNVNMRLKYQGFLNIISTLLGLFFLAYRESSSCASVKSTNSYQVQMTLESTSLRSHHVSVYKSPMENVFVAVLRNLGGKFCRNAFYIIKKKPPPDCNICKIVHEGKKMIEMFQIPPETESGVHTSSWPAPKAIWTTGSERCAESSECRRVQVGGNL